MYKKRPFTKEQLMKSKTKKSSIFMISAISIVGVFFLFLGITSFFSELYPYDIYISKEITLSIGQGVDNQYLIQGELSNKGEDEIVVQKLEFRCYTADRSAYGTHTIENIKIAPGQSYQIYEEIVSNGTLQYTAVKLQTTVIEEGEVQLQYSKDGKSFSNKQNELTAIIVGVVMTGIGIFMIIREVKRRKVLNG